MTTAVRTAPLETAAAGILSVECELTGNCQLECSHCCTLSGPKVSHGEMTLTDWQRVVDDTAELGIPAIQYIGGEPTRSLTLLPLITHAQSRGLQIEVYSNLTHVRPAMWAAFEQYGVRLATSYYSDRPEEHDRITGGRGSHRRTRRNILEAYARGIPLRVGIVHVHDGQRVAQAADELRLLGIDDIRIDRARGVGRAAAASDTIPSVSELCGRCFHHRLAVSPDGDVYGCILSRFMPTGNVRHKGLAAIVRSEQFAQARSLIPVAGAACTPDDSSDCNPASTPACNPKH
ncbi:radical SAM/SPASM domain-containing protein [Streptomyces sp. NPDC054802]